MTSISRTIVKAGLLVGTLDGLAASINFYISTQKNPIVVFQFISSAIFGKDAYADPVIYGITGIVFHYIVAFGWTILFFILYYNLSFLRKNKFITGIAYGLFVWIMMNQVVVPMTRIAKAPFNLQGAAIGALILIVAIGIPLAWVAERKYLSKS